jgi:hypothetical protein
MKKQLLAFVVLSAILCAVQSQDANAVKRNSVIKNTVTHGIKFSVSKMPVLVYVGRLPDPFNSNIQYDLYGSSGIITAAYEIYYGTNVGAVSISGGLYRAETGNQLGWYIDQGTITTSFDSFSFFEALYVDLS